MYIGIKRGIIIVILFIVSYGFIPPSGVERIRIIMTIMIVATIISTK